MSRLDAGERAVATPSNAQALKAPAVGLTMNSVPMKPTPIAVQRRQPTSSREEDHRQSR